MVEQQTQHTVDRINFHIQGLERMSLYLPSSLFSNRRPFFNIASEVSRAVRLNDQPVLAEFPKLGARISVIGGVVAEEAKPTGAFVEAIGRRVSQQVEGDLLQEAIIASDKLPEKGISDQFFDKLADLYLYGGPRGFYEASRHLSRFPLRDRTSLGSLVSAIQHYSSANLPGSERFWSDFEFFKANPYYQDHFPSEREMLDKNKRTLDVPDGTVYYSSESGVPLLARGNLALLKDLLGGKYFDDNGVSKDYPGGDIDPTWHFLVGLEPTLYISHHPGLERDKVQHYGSPETIVFAGASQDKTDAPALHGVTEVIKATVNGKGVIRFQKKGEAFSRESGQVIGTLDIDPVNHQVIPPEWIFV